MATPAPVSLHLMLMFGCLLCVFNIQSTKGRVLVLGNSSQMSKISIPARQPNVEFVKESVGIVKHENVLVESSSTSSDQSAKNDVVILREILKQWNTEECKGKLIVNLQLLPKGATPRSSPNRGHHCIILAEPNVKEKLVVNSLPKGPTPPQGPNAPHHN